MHHTIRAFVVGVCAVLALSAQPAMAQEQATVAGTIVDALGARVSGATVTLLRDGMTVADSKSGGDGTFAFASVVPGRYAVAATAKGFSPRTSEPIYVGPGSRETVDVALEIGPLQQDVVVTAEAGAILQARTGAPVTVIDLSLIHI